MAIGDSINLDGACQTAVEIGTGWFEVEAVGDTLEKTVFRNYTTGRAVNLERSVTPQTRLGGHFVQGHVNGIGNVTRFEPIGENWTLVVRVPEALERYVVPEGSIALDGISLTVAGLAGREVRISVIPQTVKMTTLRDRATGDEMNVEVDILGKYVEKFIAARTGTGNELEQKLAEWGY
jgi:riboflavin synthase